MRRQAIELPKTPWVALGFVCVGVGVSLDAIGQPLPPPSVEPPRRIPASGLLGNRRGLHRCPIPPASRVADRSGRMTSMSIGVTHSCGSYADGSVRCVGTNLRGELGVETASGVDVPTVVPGASDVRQVLVFDTSNTLALRNDGTMLAWGAGQFGLLGSVPALDTCHLGPCRRTPTVIPELRDMRSLTGLSLGACGLRADASVWCFGSLGGLGVGRSTVPIRLAEGLDVRELFSWGPIPGVRIADGTVRSVGPLAGNFTPIQPSWRVASSGSHHICALLPDRTVRCWGHNESAQLGDERGQSYEASPGRPEIDCVQDIAVAPDHSRAVRTDRSVWCWGRNAEGQAGASQSQSCAFMNRRFPCVMSPQRVEGVDQVRRVFVGQGSSCAVRTDGSVWCWGRLGDRSHRPVLTTW